MKNENLTEQEANGVKPDVKFQLPFADAYHFIVWVRGTYGIIGDNIEKFYNVPIGNDNDENGKMKTYKLEQLYEVWKAKGN
jgi:hypothetical protein